MDKQNQKIYVLDTSILIEDPDVFYKLGGSEIIVPTAVVKEIDGLKRHPDPKEPKAKAARKVARMLDRLGSYQDIAAGARTSVGSVVRIYNQYAAIDDLASEADNRVVGASIKIKSEMGEVTLLTTDNNMRTIARAYGVRSEFYPFDLKFDWMEGRKVPESIPEAEILKFDGSHVENEQKYLMTFMAAVAVFILLMAL